LVLNKKQEDRKDYVLPKDQELIPFLNGGLFEAQTDDFFPTNSNGIHQIAFNLDIPNQWFIELFEVLEQYSFTIDENSIYDAEVSIDPEMLGTIFENLLAEIDPDTEKSARKATGSFYTPREIVDYMVEQSLVQYLKTKVATENEGKLLELFKEGGENKFKPIETKKILEALSDVKILDPACGSGAFPMGALHKIINALQKLDPDASWWKEKQIENVPNVLAKQMLKEKLDGESADYVRKLGVIQNSIYGVDIQPIASEISKLRSFLSLVIDETIIDDAKNRGIQALPNLEFKFVTANTLIGLEEKQQAQGALDFGQTDELQDQLKTIRNQYLQAYGEEKVKLKKDFDNVQTKILKQEIAGRGQNKRALQLASWKPFGNESNSWFDPYWMYGVEKFDIVIGNPPYGSNIDEFIQYLESRYPFTSSDFKDIYKTFFEYCLGILNNNGLLNFITSNTFVSQPRFSDLREYLLSFGPIKLIDLGENIFENAVVPSSIIFVSNHINEPSYFSYLDLKYQSLNQKIESLRNDGNNVIKATIRENPNLIFKILDNKLRVDYQELNDILIFKDKGINYQRVNVGLSQKGKSDLSKRLFDVDANDKNRKMYWKGTDINEYQISEKTDRYVNMNIPLRANERVIINSDYFDKVPKIVWRQTASKLISSVDTKGIYFGRSIQSCVVKSKYEDLSPYYIVAILNSKVLEHQYNLLVAEKGRTFPQIKWANIKYLPFVVASQEVQRTLVKLSVKLHDFYDQEVRSKIENIIYKLYFYSYEEIKIIDPEFPLTKEEYDNYHIN